MALFQSGCSNTVLFYQEKMSLTASVEEGSRVSM